MALNLAELGMSDQQAQLITNLSRSLYMTEADFCKEILLESAQLLLADPTKMGDIIRGTLARRYPLAVVR